MRIAPVRRKDAQVAPQWLFLLASFIGLQPITVDLYLASLPHLVGAFNTTPAAVQMTLSVYIGSFAFAQLLVGPLSDRYGRRPVCLTGLSLATLAGVAASLAPSLPILIFARLAQGIGVCCVVVCARAIVRDQYEPAAGAQVLSKALSWMTLAPFAGPIVGGVVLHLWGWRACFGVMTAASAVLLWASWHWQRESNDHLNPRATRARELVTTYASFLKSRDYLAYSFMLLGSYCALFSFISASAYVFIGLHKVTSIGYGLAFASVTLGFLTGTVLLRRLMPIGGMQLALGCAATLSLTGGSVMFVMAWHETASIAAILLPMYLVMCGHGIMQPACQMGAAAPFPQNAGAAAALVGGLLHAVAAVLGWLLSRQLDGTALPMAAAIFASTVGIAGAYLLMVRPMLITRPLPA